MTEREKSFSYIKKEWRVSILAKIPFLALLPPFLPSMIRLPHNRGRRREGGKKEEASRINYHNKNKAGWEGEKRGFLSFFLFSLSLQKVGCVWLPHGLLQPEKKESVARRKVAKNASKVRRHIQQQDRLLQTLGTALLKITVHFLITKHK